MKNRIVKILLLTVVAITAVAFLCAMAMILRHNKKKK